MSFVEIKELKKHYGEGDSFVQALGGIDMEINKGEVCVLLGPSGSGKSTLLNIIGGIETADSGDITVNGEMVKFMSEKRLTQKKASWLRFSVVQLNSKFNSP